MTRRTALKQAVTTAILKAGGVEYEYKRKSLDESHL